MRAIDLVIRQLNGVNTLYHAVADDLTQSEWTARAFPGSNLPGFTLWHLARFQDRAVHTAVRGIPEVITAGRWHGLGRLQTPGIGAGFTPAEADDVARGVAQADAIAYADAVHHAVAQWLSILDDDDLDHVPDVVAHQASFPEYQHPGFRSEVGDLVGMPVWRFVSGGCIGHPRAHLGEIDALKQAIRART